MQCLKMQNVYTQLHHFCEDYQKTFNEDIADMHKHQNLKRGTQLQQSIFILVNELGCVILSIYIG